MLFYPFSLLLGLFSYPQPILPSTRFGVAGRVGRNQHTPETSHLALFFSSLVHHSRCCLLVVIPALFLRGRVHHLACRVLTEGEEAWEEAMAALGKCFEGCVNRAL